MERQANIRLSVRLNSTLEPVVFCADPLALFSPKKGLTRANDRVNY